MVRKTTFWSKFYAKIDRFYQDRLRIDIGNVEEKRFYAGSYGTEHWYVSKQKGSFESLRFLLSVPSLN